MQTKPNDSALYDLLIAVSKYPPSEKSPRENFFTESIRYILSNDPTLLAAFVELLNEGRKPLRGQLRVASQVRMKDSIIDLVISDKTQRILVEVKVGARENMYHDELDTGTRGQVQKYLDISGQHDRVCLISSRDETPEIKRHSGRALRSRNWKEIYALIESHYGGRGHGTIQTFVAKNLLSLMEHWDMKPYKGFSTTDIKASSTAYLDLYEHLLEFLENLKTNDEVRGFFKKHGFTVSGKTPRYNTEGQYFMLEFIKRVHRGKKKGVYSFCFGFDYFPSVKNMEEHFVCTPPRVGTMFWSGIWTRTETLTAIRARYKKLPISKKHFCAQYFRDKFVVFQQVPFPEFAKHGADSAVKRIIESLREVEQKGLLKLVEKELLG